VISGTPEAAPFEMFDGASNADRIKTHSGTARYWWLRSPNPSYANAPRYVSGSGTLSSSSSHAGNLASVTAGLVLM